ncbi:hypothetical protein EDD21DRAFT_442455 [Dissophora ornata]|nr:hypothetical protein EDD21DRAFT_442455 [Dissophora ornata]
MLAASLASPSASGHAKTPLNVVLIVDTYMPPGIDEAQSQRAVTFLKRTLVRILLYFQCNMDAKFQWTYQFFNSRVNQDIGVIPNRVLQSLNMSTVNSCVEEYRKIIAAEAATSSVLSGKGATSGADSAASRTTGAGSISPCYNLRRELVHSLADFGLDITSYQSPMKPISTFARSQSLQKHFPPVSIRNYMYVLSPLPRSWAETVYFLEGKKQPHSDMLMMGPRRNDILEVLKRIKDAFFDQGLWDRFLDQRTSLSWIDTGRKDNSGDSGESTKTHTRISAMMLIRSTLELIMKAFGGHIIPQHILCQTRPPRDVYSFATIFQTYRSLQIHPGLGVQMSKNSWQALPSAPAMLQSEDIRPVKVTWSGDLLCAESSKFLCSVDIAKPLSTPMSDGDSCSEIDRINSLQVIKRIPSRVLSANLHLIRIRNTLTCFPQNNCDEPCEHASYLLKSLRLKNDVLLLEITFQEREDRQTSDDSVDEHGSREQEKLKMDRDSQQHTRLAILHSTVAGSGVVEILEESSGLRDTNPIGDVISVKARPFSMAMMEKSWSKLGAFVDKKDTQAKMGEWYRLDEMPTCIVGSFKQQQTGSECAVEARLPISKPLPGASVEDIDGAAAEMGDVGSIDDLCLEIRKMYIKYLYQDYYNVSDYVKRLNAASKEITALAAKQSVPLKDAQQKLVAFIIEFLRIWPCRMESKYKQIAKELNVGKVTESKSQDHYVVLEDERPELDAWKTEVMKSAKDIDLRRHLRKLKTKDTQIQIVQNLQILLLLDKYGLEENKPFKKDPGALKSANLFMDELCIEASIDSNPTPGLRSPQTPRSRDMDPAKKFFTRIVARYYETALPKVVEKLSIKCGVEKSLLMSPRASRGSKRAGIKRSISMGVLQKPSPLDLAATMREDAGGPKSSGSSTPTDITVPKYGVPMTRQLTSDNSARNVLNRSIFRNRQVVMTLSSVTGVGAAPPSSSSSTTVSKEPVASARSHQGPIRSKSMTSLNDLEDEDAPPKLAKLKLKKFYHDKESEEVLKQFRRQRPLSKADVTIASPAQGNNNVGDEEDEDEDLGALAKYLSRRGTTSWGVIKSMNASSSNRDNDILKSPSSDVVQRRNSLRRDRSPSRHYGSLSSLSLPTESIVPSTPISNQGLGYRTDGLQKSPSTPTGRAQLRRYMSQQSPSLGTPDMDRVPTTPTRRAQIHRDRTFASQIRGRGGGGSGGSVPFPGFDILGSPSKRRREDEDVLDSYEPELPSSPLGSMMSRHRTTALPSFSPLSPKFMRHQQKTSFFDELQATRPDRKRIHLGGSSSSKAVLVPGTPS